MPPVDARRSWNAPPPPPLLLVVGCLRPGGGRTRSAGAVPRPVVPTLAYPVSMEPLRDDGLSGTVRH